MESQELLKKYKNKILNTGVILLTLIIVLSIYKNQNQTIGALRSARDSEIKKNEVLATISQTEKKIDSYKNIFNKKDPSLLINALSDIARESNVKIISINPKGQDDRKVYIKYPFDLTVGVENYHAIGRFISNVESYNDLFFIDRATIRPIEKVSTSGQRYNLIVSLTISTIVFKN